MKNEHLIMKCAWLAFVAIGVVAALGTDEFNREDEIILLLLGAACVGALPFLLRLGGDDRSTGKGALGRDDHSKGDVGTPGKDAASQKKAGEFGKMLLARATMLNSILSLLVITKGNPDLSFSSFPPRVLEKIKVLGEDGGNSARRIADEFLDGLDDMPLGTLMRVAARRIAKVVVSLEVMLAEDAHLVVLFVEDPEEESCGAVKNILQRMTDCAGNAKILWEALAAMADGNALWVKALAEREHLGL